MFDRDALCFCGSAALPFVTVKAASGILCQGALGGMHVVAGGAAHFRRRAITEASLQQANLIAVDIGVLHVVGWIRRKILVQRLAGAVRKCRNKFVSLRTVVT